jgi:hypothetical protein
MKNPLAIQVPSIPSRNEFWPFFRPFCEMVASRARAGPHGKCCEMVCKFNKINNLTFAKERETHCEMVVGDSPPYHLALAIPPLPTRARARGAHARGAMEVF